MDTKFIKNDVVTSKLLPNQKMRVIGVTNDDVLCQWFEKTTKPKNKTFKESELNLVQRVEGNRVKQLRDIRTF